MPGRGLSFDVTLEPSRITEGVLVTARRVEEIVRRKICPSPLSVVTGELVDNAGAFNVNRLKELIPTVQVYSTNPRNTSINIRGLGAPFGLTNDGIEQGVGLYVDGVFCARPASAALDFIDVERIEVLRGPQGTLFGKNTTAGAINVTTRKPTFTPETDVELNYGNLGFSRRRRRSLARFAEGCRASLLLRHAARRHHLERQTGAHDHNLNNLGLRGQVLVAPSDRFARQSRPTHAAAPGRLYAGCRWRRADAAPGKSAVPADRGRPQVHPAELQSVRSRHRRRHAAPLLPGSGRRCAQRGLGRRPRPADVDDGLALLALESVERP